MRVIAGRFRSRPLIAPPGRDTRPTGDRLRETLFNVLAPHIEGSTFADLFAGTGAVGIEALSRGAQRVYFAENARPALIALRKNLHTFSIEREASIEAKGAMPLLRRLATEGVQLDIAFLDPPYQDEAAYRSALGFLAAHPVLSAEALVIAEHVRGTPLPPVFGDLECFRRLKQGEAVLSFYRRNKTMVTK